MRVGISLLTLVPGISGGSETYARALTRTLAAEGTLDYRVFLPTIAPDAGGGLRPGPRARPIPAARSTQPPSSSTAPHAPFRAGSRQWPPRRSAPARYAARSS